MRVMNSEDIMKNECINEKQICKHLRKVLGYSPDNVTDVDVAVCTSEEDTCCVCHKDMEEREE